MAPSSGSRAWALLVAAVAVLSILRAVQGAQPQSPAPLVPLDFFHETQCPAGDAIRAGELTSGSTMVFEGFIDVFDGPKAFTFFVPQSEGGGVEFSATTCSPSTTFDTVLLLSQGCNGPAPPERPQPLSHESAEEANYAGDDDAACGPSPLASTLQRKLAPGVYTLTVASSHTYIGAVPGSFQLTIRGRPIGSEHQFRTTRGGHGPSLGSFSVSLELPARVSPDADNASGSPVLAVAWSSSRGLLGVAAAWLGGLVGHSARFAVSAAKAHPTRADVVTLIGRVTEEYVGGSLSALAAALRSAPTVPRFGGMSSFRLSEVCIRESGADAPFCETLELGPAPEPAEWCGPPAGRLSPLPAPLTVRCAAGLRRPPRRGRRRPLSPARRRAAGPGPAAAAPAAAPAAAAGRGAGRGRRWPPLVEDVLELYFPQGASAWRAVFAAALVLGVGVPIGLRAADIAERREKARPRPRPGPRPWAASPRLSPAGSSRRGCGGGGRAKPPRLLPLPRPSQRPRPLALQESLHVPSSDSLAPPAPRRGSRSFTGTSRRSSTVSVSSLGAPAHRLRAADPASQVPPRPPRPAPPARPPTPGAPPPAARLVAGLAGDAAGPRPARLAGPFQPPLPVVLGLEAGEPEPGGGLAGGHAAGAGAAAGCRAPLELDDRARPPVIVFDGGSAAPPPPAIPGGFAHSFISSSRSPVGGRVPVTHL
eukprot:tig00000870_g5126.t1